jgi:hypothetical protein
MKLLKNRFVIGSIVLLLVVLFIIFQAVRAGENRSRVTRVTRMQDDILEEMTPEKMLVRMLKREKGPPPELRDKGKAMFEELKKLPPEQREDLLMDMMAKMMSKYARRIWDMDKKQRDKFLEALAKLDQGRQQGGNNQGTQGRGGNDRPPQLASSGRSPDERRDAQARRFLDNTTPEDRAKMIVEIGQLNQFRAQLGLPPFSMAPRPRAGQ